MMKTLDTLLTRRMFLRGSAVVLAGAGTVPLWLARATAAQGRKKKILVAIFLRGAADGLNIVVPFGEKRYYQLRPTLAIQPPGSPNGAIDLDGRFGLNPAMQPLKALWDRQQIAFVEAAGSPDSSRSHFDAQDYMESGTPGLKTTGDGWLNRALVPGEAGASPLRAVATSAQLPRTLQGPASAIAIRDVQQFQTGQQDVSGILERMYAGTSDNRLERTSKDAFEAMRMIRTINQQPINPASMSLYAPGGELGRSMQQIARLIKADAGVEAAFAEMGGWDHHANENGQLANLLRQLSTTLSAFAQDMGDRMEDIVVVTMSEFGRTPQENGNSGTDHGHGGLMMVMGGPVKGGRIYGTWPGLEVEQLYERRDLAVTTDFRDVLGELVSGHLGQTNLSRVFPGYQLNAPPGLLRV
jgi:uncharacterized protein (DUF1501 family)